MRTRAPTSKARKPIRVFFSRLTRRFYATRAYRLLPNGIVECTGEKFDVTSDIGALINEHEIEFIERKTALKDAPR